MNAQLATPSSPSSARLGRSAWVVLLAGMFASAFVTAATLVAGGLDARRAGVELLPAYGVAVGVLIAAYGWSLMLAARALRSGENSRLPIRLVSFSLFPLAAYAIAHWFSLPLHPLLNCPWFLSAFMPVLLPFLALTVPTGTILVPKIMRRIEARRARKSVVPWTAKRRRVMSALIMAAWVLLWGAVLLPVPIMVYCMVFRRDEGVTYACDHLIVKRIPNFVMDLSESALRKIPYGRYQRAQRHQLYEGHASVERLRTRALDAIPQVRDASLYGLSRRDPRAAAAMAAEASSTSVGNSRRTVQYILAQHGTHEQRAAFLELALSGTAVGQPFLQTLEHATPDPELIPLLEKYFHSGCSGHEWALLAMAKWLPEERAEALLKEAVDSDDSAAQVFILDNNCYGGVQERVWSKVLLHGVTHKDAAVRMKAWNSFWLNSNVSQPVQADCVEKLLKIQDGNDPVQRRGAAQRLVRGLWIRELAALDEKPWFQKIRLPNTPLDPTQPVETGGVPAPLSDAECAALDDVATAAREWLAKQGSGK